VAAQVRNARSNHHGNEGQRRGAQGEAAQGEVVRKLKAAKAPKAEVTAAVALLKVRPR
jgi:hypothetical protein